MITNTWDLIKLSETKTLTNQEFEYLISYFLIFNRQTPMPYSEYIKLCLFFHRFTFLTTHWHGVIFLEKLREIRDYLNE